MTDSLASKVEALRGWLRYNGGDTRLPIDPWSVHGTVHIASEEAT